MPTKAEIKHSHGTIIPNEGVSLKELWWAFLEGGTWQPLGRQGKQRARIKHVRYAGKIVFEWWGPAIHFEVEEDGSGLVSGAMLGHIRRHGAGLVDRLDIVFD